MASWCRYWRAVLILLVVFGTMCHQAEGFSDDHDGQGSVPTHCCPVCHAGHMAVVQPALATALNAPVQDGWWVAFQQCPDLHDPLIVFSAPRGPPV